MVHARGSRKAGALEPHLRVLSAVTHLTLRGHPDTGQRLLSLPDVSSRLCQLKLNFQGYPWFKLGDLAGSLAAATRLTLLELSWADLQSDKHDDGLARFLGACRALEELRLCEAWPQDMAEALVNAPTLSTLRTFSSSSSGIYNPLFAEVALGRWAHMTGLQALAGVPASSFAAAVASEPAAMAKLTRLSFEAFTGVYGDWLEITPHLLNLTGLQVLEVPGGIFTFERVGTALRPLRELRELVLGQWDGDVGQWDSQLASLPALTKLHLGFTCALGRFPSQYLPNGFARLRDCTLETAELQRGPINRASAQGAMRLLEAMTALERLTLEADERLCQWLLADWPQLPHLTSLHLTAYPCDFWHLQKGFHRWLTHLRNRRACARFLARIGPVVQLHLHRVVQWAHWQMHACKIAALTELRELTLEYRNCRTPWLYQRRSSTGLRPLTSLWQLESFVTEGSWEDDCMVDFHERMVAVRWEYGLPPTKLRLSNFRWNDPQFVYPSGWCGR
eukprot:jgi/Botrbrau1/8835/Bobra.0335s0022.1